MRVSAPGKLMISGEYAVLEGAEAVVAAVGRRARVTLVARASAAAPPEVVAARAEAERAVGAIEGELELDASELRAEGRKLGLGSSAAGAAAAASLVFAARGHSLDDASVRRRVFDCAFAGHRSIAPEGSGADVAAACLGGFVRFRRRASDVETQPLAWPSGLHTVVVWTGHAVRTSDMLAAVSALRASRPDDHRRAMRRLAAESERMVSALIDQALADVVHCTHGYAVAMEELGKAAGVSIVDDTLRKIQQLAVAAGGAAKPSGAGGGDVAIGVFPSMDGADVFQTGCISSGFDVLSLELGSTGGRVEEQ